MNSVGFLSRAACGRLGTLAAAWIAAAGSCWAQLEVVNGLAHRFKVQQEIEGYIEIVNRGTQSETASLTVQPLRPRQAPPLDSSILGRLSIPHTAVIPPGEKVRIPFRAPNVDRKITTGCMIYVEPQWASAYRWDTGDSIGFTAVVRYGVAVLAAGGVVPDSLVSAKSHRDSTGLWLDLSNRSTALWIPKASWTERGGSIQKNEWVLLPGESKRIRWSPTPQSGGKMVLQDEDRRRWQWNL